MNLSPAGLRPPLALPHFFRLLALLCACSVSTAFAQGSAAKAYPTQPIRLVVAGTPGTSMDIVARIIEPELSQRLGQPVIVDNRAGASGIIGTDFVAKSASDGYTLLLGAQSMVVVPLLVHTPHATTH
jgi:tripartite-type tricarboxylate transporter receptor subunit TctC